MSELVIEGLRAGIAGIEILQGIDLTIRSGEVHAVMGPNGAGKSTLGNVLMGHPAYTVTAGSVTLDGIDLLGLPTWQRAQAGLFLAPQDPVELPGVPIQSVVEETFAASGHATPSASNIRALLEREAAAIGVPAAFLDRGLNVDCSGGEKKRIETLQMVASSPKFAILDELDSGLDIDALHDVAHRVRKAVTQSTEDNTNRLGILAITHYSRLLDVLLPDVVHVLVHGKIVETADFALIADFEASGYGKYLTNA